MQQIRLQIRCKLISRFRFYSDPCVSSPPIRHAAVGGVAENNLPFPPLRACRVTMRQLQETYSEHFSEVFKTITTDNGSEFADLSNMEKIADTLIYYAHPYTSCDKATVERHDGLIRRFIPKGKRIDDFSGQQISAIEIWCNCLPRRLLGYRTPDEIFEEEIDRIY